MKTMKRGTSVHFEAAGLERIYSRKAALIVCSEMKKYARIKILAICHSVASRPPWISLSADGSNSKVWVPTVINDYGDISVPDVQL
jgi:hypothetical protein